MATKDVKKVTPKGRRLGWTSMKDAQHIVVNAVTVKGKRVVVKDVQEAMSKNSLLVP